MEVVKQNVFTYGDGLPAYKSGEWYGSKPNHFVGSKLILKPIKLPEKEFKIGHSRHYPERLSTEFVYKNEKKLVPPFIHEEIYKPAKRPLVPHYTDPPFHERNCTYRPKGQLFSDYIYPFLQKKIRHLNINTSPDIKKEYNVETVMNRKKRIYSLTKQRNDLHIWNPGDKNYNCVENSKDFFKLEGIVVGSTNRMHFKKTIKKGEDNFYQTLDLNVKIMNPNKVWQTRLNNESFDHDQNYVKKLNDWENTVFKTEENANQAKK